MTLRKKNLLLISATLLGLSAVSCAVLSRVLAVGFGKAESEVCRQNVQRVQHALFRELSMLSQEAGAWAAWDRTHPVAEDDTPDHVEGSLPAMSFTELRLNLVIIVNSSGHVVFGRGFDDGAEDAVRVAARFREHLVPTGVLLRRQNAASHPTDGVSGIVVLAEGPMLVAARPIMVEDRQGVVPGTLIMGRNLDAAALKLLTVGTHLSASVCRVDDDNVPAAVKQWRNQPLESPTLVQATADASIAGFAVLQDIYRKPALILRVDSPRAIHRIGLATMRTFLLSLLGLGVILVAAAMILIEKLLPARVARLNAQARSFEGGEPQGRRLVVDGDDDLAGLAARFNVILQALETAQLQRREALARFASVVENTPLVAIQSLDRDGAICQWNDTCTRLYGFSKEEALGRRLQELILPEASAQEFERMVADLWNSGQGTAPREWQVRTRQGATLWVASSMFPVCENGQVTGIFRMDVDVTAHRQAEAKVEATNRELEEMNRQLEHAIEHAQQLAMEAQVATISKSEFLARMSHEIRTPMNGVIGFTDMLLDTQLTEEQIDYARTIKHNCETLLDLINDILDFSKIEAGQLDLEVVEFDLEASALEVCELIGPRLKGKPIELLLRIGDTVPTRVKGDPGRFRQVLVNLLGNAAKFTESGEIELALGNRQESDQQVRLQVDVRDTGVGVSSNKMGLIFEAFQQADRFTTRKYGGSGLGLAICKQLADLMGGDIWAESTPGRGSAFHFATWFEKVPEQETATPAYGPLAGKKALIVDDNSSNLEILGHILLAQGMRVTAVDRAGPVLELLNQALAQADPFEIAIIDLRMPITNGYDLAQRIRREASSVARLALLALSDAAEWGAKKSCQAGFDAVLVKPAGRRKLLDVLLRILGGESGKFKGEQSVAYAVCPQETADIGQPVRILLAEDNLANQKLARLLLAKAGYQVEVAGNGQEAVERFCAQPEAFDLILMDVQMPEMDGLKATRIIRDKGFTRTPIVAMTANAMKGDREKCIAAGMNDYIAKPIRRENVLGIVEEWVLARDKA